MVGEYALQHTEPTAGYMDIALDHINDSKLYKTNI